MAELARQEAIPCVSIHIPTRWSSFSEKEKIPALFKHAIRQVQKVLEKNNYGEDTISAVLRELGEMVAEVKIDQAGEGVGLYLSPQYRLLLHFPLPLMPKASIGSRFDVSEIVATLNMLGPYSVLLLSQKHTRLFSAVGPTCEEIKNGHFPYSYEDEFQYNTIRPARPGQSHYAGEPSRTNQAHMENAYRRVVENLKDIAGDGPLILLGDPKLVGMFRQFNEISASVIDSITGNYHEYGANQIARIAWPVMEKHLLQKRSERLQKARDNYFRDQAVAGFQPVLEAIRQKQGSVLFVERQIPFNTSSNLPEQLTVLAGDMANPSEFHNPVNALMIEMIRQNHPEILVVEDNALQDMNGVLLTVY